MTRDAAGPGADAAGHRGLARTDGFAGIESYGVIGDGESVALVARDGAIDWWAAPAMDSPPVFAAVLDPQDGGSFTLEPTVPYQVKRRYLPGTNVLETTFSTRDGTVRVLDSLNQGANGPLPWAELARDIRAGDGAVPMRWRVAPGTLFHQVRPWVTFRDVPLLHAGGLMMAIVADQAGEPRPGLGEFSGEFTAKSGQYALLTLIVADHAPLVVPSAVDVRQRREATGHVVRARLVHPPRPDPGSAGHARLDAELHRRDGAVHTSVLRTARASPRRGNRAAAAWLPRFQASTRRQPCGRPAAVGCYGDLLECVWLAVDRAGAHLDPASAD